MTSFTTVKTFYILMINYLHEAGIVSANYPGNTELMTIPIIRCNDNCHSLKILSSNDVQKPKNRRCHPQQKSQKSHQHTLSGA